MEKLKYDVIIIAEIIFNKNSKKEKSKLCYGIVTEFLSKEDKVQAEFLL